MSPERLRWHQRRMAFLDTETTGPVPENDRIVQACFGHAGGGQPTESKTWLVNPGVEISAGAIAVHGITNERVQAEGLAPSVALAELLDLLIAAVDQREPIVIMNAPFDLTIVKAEADRYQLAAPIENGLFVDPLVLDKHIDPYRKGSRKLDALCQHYGARLDGAHDAAFDAIAAARVAYRIGQKIFDRIPEFANIGPEELQEVQRRAYRAQAASLNEYWIKKGDQRRVDNFDWPVRRWKEAE